MPIYEYEPVNPRAAGECCFHGFEYIQRMNDAPLTACPTCGCAVKRIISRCIATMSERPRENVCVEGQVKGYERAGMWSHAAELADKHSEKTGDRDLKTRALDNYKKAGYDFDLPKNFQ